VRRFVEEYQSADHDVAVAEELLRDDFVDHGPFRPFPDRGGVIARFGMFFRRFRICTPTSAQYADGDHVIEEDLPRHAPGTFIIPGTGNPIAFDVIDIVTARRMPRDHTNVDDGLALMTGVGAVPAMGDARHRA
jgi:hypothetical protein